MSELIKKTAAELSAVVASGEASAVEVTQAHLDRIASVDDSVKAFLHVNAEDALAQARAVDRKRAAGEPLGALAGVPVAVKDLFATIGLPTTCGSKILDGWVPPYESTVTRRLRDGGAVLIGKTNMDEFAMGSSTENSGYGTSRNPWNLSKVPGGSSGGSAAAVAAYEAPLALGTDTGGSIRQPAAVCGIVGTKPTYGGNSRYGVVAFASSLDTPGPFGRTVLDTALLHEVMSGHDPMDSTSIDAPVPPVVAAAREAVRPAGRRRLGRGGHGGHPGGGVRRRGQAADHARHLRPVQRLLRRLLRQGAAGADADHQGLPERLQPGGRPYLAADADHRVRHRRARRRPDGDVPG
jgi:aspartyl-tRNA(Asn)/glutamyl-tRNA(Gln) amidotransferase subunit A